MKNNKTYPAKDIMWLYDLHSEMVEPFIYNKNENKIKLILTNEIIKLDYCLSVPLTFEKKYGIKVVCGNTHRVKSAILNVFGACYNDIKKYFQKLDFDKQSKKLITEYELNLDSKAIINNTQLSKLRKLFVQAIKTAKKDSKENKNSNNHKKAEKQLQIAEESKDF